MANSTPISQYTEPHQFEPLLPQKDLDTLRAQARSVIEQSLQLTGSLHPATIQSLRELVRAMNSYYSNRIEGQSTHPRNIERALKSDFSDKPDIAKLQRLALAHIDAEKELESLVDSGESPLTWDFLQKAHQAIYGRLTAEDRTSPDGRVIVPGELRQESVAVGRHEPPIPDALPRFLKRFDSVYSGKPSLEDTLIFIASAHQRMAWIHPFLDGNGRACRLQTHCALWQLGKGLWSVSRGFARARDNYYEKLDAADSPREGDLDGRGNLSEKHLWNWCNWFIGVCHDQVRFMASMFQLDEIRLRIEALIAFRSAHDSIIRKEAVAPLYHVFLAGPTPRGDFLQMTGLGERTARTLLSRLLETGLLESKGHTAPVRFAFPLDALQFLLPGLYPEAAAKSDD